MLPSLPQQEERSEVTPQGRPACDPEYQAAGGDSGDSDQQLLERLLQASAALPPEEVDSGYQVHAQVPPGGDSSPPSSRGGVLGPPPSGPGPGCEDVEQQLLLLGGVSSSPGPVDFSYQSFQSLVEPAEKLGAEEPPGEAFTATSEATSLPPDDPASPSLHTSLFSLLSTDPSASIVMESGYHSVEPTCVW